MPYNVKSHKFDPDKKFLRKIAKESESRKEAAIRCGISTRTFASRMKAKGLHKELEELTTRGKKIGGKNRKGKKRVVKQTEVEKKMKPIHRVDSEGDGEDFALNAEKEKALEALHRAPPEREAEFFTSLHDNLSKLKKGEPVEKSPFVSTDGSDGSDTDIKSFLIKLGNYLIDN